MRCAKTIIQKGIVYTSTEALPGPALSSAKFDSTTKSPTCSSPMTTAMR
jgi:hypothetical protein